LIAVYADTNRDRSIDKRFLLAFELPESEPLDIPAHFPAAHIEFEPGYLRVVAGNQAVELYVTGNQTPAWNPKGISVWRRAGYGLSHSTGETGIIMPLPNGRPTITAEYCNADSDCYPGYTDPYDGGGGGGGGGGDDSCDGRRPRRHQL
jgi:hypothetical protein